MSDERLAVVPFGARTGELLELHSMPDEHLAALAEHVKEWERAEFYEFKRAVSQEIHDRMDGRLEWTLHVNGFKVEGVSPQAHVAWDEDELRRTINELAAESLVPVGAIEEVFRPKKGYDISKSGLNKLMRLGGVVKERLEACRREKPTPRWARVSRER